MNPTPPNQKNKIEGSTIRVGQNAHFGDATTYNNYYQGQSVRIPHLLTNDVPVNADHILGRAAELVATKAYLAQNRTTVLVNGIGGIGKTSVATKFMVLYGHEYAHRAWIIVQSTLLDTFVNHTTLLKALGITEDVQKLMSAQQSAAALDCVLHHLNQLKNALIVIDNANSLEDLLENKHFFDALHCHCIITSRNSPQDWTVVPIEHLPAAEAVQIFKKHARSVATEGMTSSHTLSNTEEKDKAIENLLEKLYFHTLLIELVAKAVYSAGLSFDALQTMIETQFIHHQELNEEIISSGKHGDSLHENTKRTNIEDYIWLIFSQVQGLNDKSKDILRGIALLPLGHTISRNELKKHCALLSIEDIVRSLTLLVERGWLDLERTEDNKPAYKMHPLIADVVKKHLELTAAFAKAYIKRVADLIYYVNTNPEHNIFEINKNRPFGDRLSDLFFDENTAGVSELLDYIGNLEDEFGFYQKAADYKERALKIAESIFDKSHEILAERQNNLANVYRNLGKYDQAAELLEAALASDLKNFGQEHPKVATRQNDLANVYRGLGKYDQAAELFESALASDLKNFGKEHPNVAIDQSNLALAYQDLGKYDRAAALLESSLANSLKNFGQEHPCVAVSQSILGDVYRNLGKNKQAVVLLEAALASGLKNFGQEHPHVAISQWNLAMVYINIDRKLEAKVLLHAAYQNFLKNLGAEHPHTVDIQTWFPKAE